MDKITRVAARVGVDLSKRVIQVHAVDETSRVLVNRALSRDKFLPWCGQLPPGCLVVMEVSSSAHHWARKLLASKRGFKALLTAQPRGSYSRSLSPSLTSSMNKSFDQARPMALSRRFSNALKLSPSRRTSMARQLLPSAAVATHS